MGWHMLDWFLYTEAGHALFVALLVVAGLSALASTPPAEQRMGRDWHAPKGE